MTKEIEEFENGELCLSIKIKRLGNNRFLFDVMKSQLTEIEDKALKIFLKRMVIEGAYQEYKRISQLENFDDFERFDKL